MPVRVAAVLWDVGGTLVERHVSERDVLLRALAAAGINPLALHATSIERLREYRLQVPLRWRSMDDERAGFREMAALLVTGLSPPARGEQVERIAQAFADYDRVYRVIPGMREVLEEVAARGIPQGVVSNWPPSLRRFLDYHRLEGYFSVVICSAEEGIVKPDPELLRRALQRLDVPPAHALYIGDDEDLDITPARALGMPTIHFSPTGAPGRADAREPAELRRRLRSVLASPP